MAGLRPGPHRRPAPWRRCVADLERTAASTSSTTFVELPKPGDWWQLCIQTARLLLMHGVMSDCGEMMLCITSDRGMTPDPAFYTDCMEQCFHELSTATR